MSGLLANPDLPWIVILVNGLIWWGVIAAGLVSEGNDCPKTAFGWVLAMGEAYLLLLVPVIGQVFYGAAILIGLLATPVVLVVGPLWLIAVLPSRGLHACTRKFTAGPRGERVGAGCGET